MASLQDRVIGAMRLNVPTFEEVEHDQSATGQAAIVVLAGAVSGGLGGGSLTGTLAGAVLGLLGWALASFVVLIVGTKVLPGRNTQADFGQVARTLGFAQAPYIFGILGIIPILGYLIRFALWIWVLVAMVIAVRQALDYDDTVRAIIVCVIAWAIIFVMALIATAIGVGAAIVGAGVSNL
jgi:hypothetical protein